MRRFKASSIPLYRNFHTYVHVVEYQIKRYKDKKKKKKKKKNAWSCAIIILNFE